MNLNLYKQTLKQINVLILNWEMWKNINIYNEKHKYTCIDPAWVTFSCCFCQSLFFLVRCHYPSEPRVTSLAISESALFFRRRRGWHMEEHSRRLLQAVRGRGWERKRGGCRVVVLLGWLFLQMLLEGQIR